MIQPLISQDRGMKKLCPKYITFLPISGLRGTNIQTRVERDVCSWFDGQCLFEALDGIEVAPLDPNGPFRYHVL
ncbi:hypothetical protein Tco_0042656 [Tanacetum coccineum]